MIILSLSLMLAGFEIPGFTMGTGTPPPVTVPVVELNRYAGLWYEIASFPFTAQRGCYGTTAEYQLQSDGNLSVTNRCLDGKNGPVREIEGKAWVKNSSAPAKLKVKFFSLMPAADYWIIDLDVKDYSYAVVSTPNRKYLWILSREPRMKDFIYGSILRRLVDQGFNPARLEQTPQPGNDF